MKHIRSMSRIMPYQANQFQDFICYKSAFLAEVVDAKGGSLPLLTYIVNKCDIPE